jgi:hypothetical protein
MVRIMLRRLRRVGIDLPFLVRSGLGRITWFRSDLKMFRRKITQEDQVIDFFTIDTMPFLTDRDSDAGIMTGHYFVQDLLVAQEIYHESPVNHLDVGSRVDGFVAHVATFMPIKIMDIRPSISKTRNIEFVQADLMNSLEKTETFDSVSCLHALEHFGLGRYGDSIDPNGWFTGLKAISRLLSPGGHAYISLPVGRKRVEFNAHRVFDAQELAGVLTSLFVIEKFFLIDDSGELVPNQPILHLLELASKCEYGCGIWKLTALPEVN